MPRIAILFLIVVVLLHAPLGMEAQCPADSSLEGLFSSHQYTRAMHHLTGHLPSTSDTQRYTCDTYYLLKAGELYNRMGKNQQARRYLLEALHRLQGSTDSTSIMTATAKLAHIHNSLGDFSSAVKGIHPVLSYAYRHKNLKLEHDCVNLLGGIELQNGRTSDAIRYFTRSLELVTLIPYPEFEAYDNMQMAFALLQAGQPEAGEKQLARSLTLAEQSKDTLTMAVISLINAAKWKQKQEYQQWQRETDTAIKLASALRHEPLLSGAYSQLLEYYVVRGEYGAALQAGQQALQLLDNNPMPLFEVYIDSLLYTVHKEMGNHKEALQLFESYHKNKNAILNEEQMALLEEQKSQFTLREKNLTIENQRLQLANASKQKVLLIILNVLLLGLLSAVIFFRWWKSRMNANTYKKEKMLESLLAEEKRTLPGNETKIESISVPGSPTPDERDHEIETFSEDRRDLYEEMMHRIESEKLYLNPHLDQKLVITLLGTNRAYLYQAISQHAQTNFKNIINFYRVREVKRLIELSVDNGRNDLPDNLYTESGFNSLATYHRIFKQFTGLTPKEYMQEYARDIGK